MREAELSYWKQEFAKAEISKEFWKVVNKVQGKIKSKVIGTIVNKDGDILTSDKEKAESINEYFTSIGHELASEFSSDNKNNMNFIYRVSPTTTRITLSPDKVCAKLHNIKKKTGGMDQIAAHKLTAAGEMLFEGLYNIYIYIYNVPKKRECFKLFQFYLLLMLHGAYRFQIRSFLKA